LCQAGTTRCCDRAEENDGHERREGVIELAEILLIDDVPVVRTLLCKFMSKAGHTVTERGGGKEASSTLNLQRFHVIVTDLWMKEGGGLEFIQRTRADGIKTPIIAITTGAPDSPTEAAGSVALQAGADRVLIKPVSRGDLLDAITQLIGVPAR
jgi:CheY-like chemotaxis protein